MFDIPSIRIGKIFGIPVEVNLSWVIVFALVSFTLATSYYPQIPQSAGTPGWVFGVLGAVTALLFFGSILAHELTHSVVTRAEGGRVDKITLFIFGGVAELEDEPHSPMKELLMAAAGPAMSLLIAGVSYLGYVAAVRRGAPWWLSAPLDYMASINLLVGAFNLLPGFPLDGGRVFRSILWAITGDILRATRWAARSGQFIGWSMVAAAVLTVLNGSANFVWFGLVGWFIAWLAGASYRQQQIRSRLAGVTMGEIMTPHPEYVSGDMTVEDLVHDHMLGSRHSRYPVIFEGAIIGIVSLSDVKTIPREDWPHVRVADVTNRDLATVSVSSEASVDDVMPRLAGDRPGAILVVHDGRLAGIVTRADVISLLQSG